MAKGFVGNIESLTTGNSNFRKVVYTAHHSQLVVMSIRPKDEIGFEVHPDNDQFIRIERGEGKAIIDGNEYKFSDGFAIIIPAGSKHNIINTSEINELKLYTIYSPAHHKDGTIHETKEVAESSEEEFDGATTE